MTQHYLLPCSCGQQLRVTAAQAGGQVACGCGHLQAVPTLRGLRELALAPAEAAGPTALGWTKTHGLFFSGGIVMAMAGLALIGFHVLQYVRYVGFTVDHTDSVVAAHQAEIEQMSTLELLDDWKKVTSEGLGEPTPAPWIAAQRMIAANLMWIKAGGAAIVAGVLASVLSLFVARPRLA